MSPDAYGLNRARKVNIPAHIVNHRHFASRTDFENALQKQIDAYQPDPYCISWLYAPTGC